MMKKIIVLLLVLLLAGCNTMDNAIKDLEESNYTIEIVDNDFENIVEEYKVLDSNGKFAAYILEFDSNSDAVDHFDKQDYESKMTDENLQQVFVVYKKLIIAFIDDGVYEAITGDTYQ